MSDSSFSGNVKILTIYTNMQYYVNSLFFVSQRCRFKVLISRLSGSRLPSSENRAMEPRYLLDINWYRKSKICSIMKHESVKRVILSGKFSSSMGNCSYRICPLDGIHVHFHDLNLIEVISWKVHLIIGSSDDIWWMSAVVMFSQGTIFSQVMKSSGEILHQ